MGETHGKLAQTTLSFFLAFSHTPSFSFSLSNSHSPYLTHEEQLSIRPHNMLKSYHMVSER